MKKLLVDIKLPDVIKPEDLKTIVSNIAKAVPIEEYGDHVVILSGRMPVWAYGALVHHFHPAKAVATFDPRLQGGVVVATHSPDVKVGDVVSVSDARKVAVEPLALTDEKEKVASTG